MSRGALQHRLANVCRFQNHFYWYLFRRYIPLSHRLKTRSRSLPRLPPPKAIPSRLEGRMHWKFYLKVKSFVHDIITRQLLWNMPGLFLRYNRCQEARAKIAKDAEDVGGSDAESETSSVASGMHANNHNLLEQSESSSPRGLPGRRSWQLACKFLTGSPWTTPWRVIVDIVISTIITPLPNTRAIEICAKPLYNKTLKHQNVKFSSFHIHPVPLCYSQLLYPSECAHSLEHGKQVLLKGP